MQSRWGGGSHMFASTQMAHVGFMTKLAWYLRTGSTVHLLDKWRAGDVLRLVSQYRMPSIGGVSAQVALMLRAPEARTLDFSSVQSLVMGGGASSPALVAEAREVFGAAYSNLARARELARWPVSALRGTKATMLDPHRDELWAAVQREMADMAELAMSPENIEAVTAFMEKREPDFAQFRS